ncbi:hypothetical protein Nepgr_018191 [Nepenthes gracilis]|uniref:Stress-response A/B barrel domain-containing protein n=1 Tax=Nepenthes gracilis TaxID=150966 RepID=A0AAD3XU23_NEPGR|nr:hypothetical protein Nepgr_018191 [Nepenthes gracilis]
MSPGSIVEHVVLFNINDDEDPTKVNDLVNGLLALNSLSQVLYLTAGPIFRTRSSPLKFTHMIHARFRSKDDLFAYLADRAHVKVGTELARPISVDHMALDWAVDSLDGPEVPLPGRAMRVTFFKLKEEAAEDEKHKILEEFERIKGSCSSWTFEQISFGENFSPERAKGYGVGSAVIFPDLNELDACEDYEDAVRSLVDKFKGALDAYITVDYVVPRSISTATIL